jgi:hypothetical protein
MMVLRSVRGSFADGHAQASFEHFYHTAMGGGLPPRTRNAVAYELAERGEAWPFVSRLSHMTDDDILRIPGVGKQGLRAVRRIAPYRGSAPQRARLRAPRPKGQHPWWLLP